MEMGQDGRKGRGCLYKLGVMFAIIFGLALVGKLLATSGGSGEPQATNTNGASSRDVASYQPLTEQQKAAALRHMAKDVDKVEETTFYYDRSIDQSLGSNGFYAYVGKKDGAPWLRIVIRYAGEDWLFFNRMTIKTEGLKLELAPLRPEHQVGSGYVSEWIDSRVTKREYALLETVAMSKSAILRLEGPHFQKDRTISMREKTAIMNTVMAYRALGAQAPPD